MFQLLLVLNMSLLLKRYPFVPSFSMENQEQFNAQNEVQNEGQVTEPATDAVAEVVDEQALIAEPTSVKQEAKGRRNQKRRQTLPRVGKWLIAKVERLTAFGMVVRQGRFRAHCDFAYMSLSDEGTARRFQPGESVRCRILSYELKGGLPRVTMLGQMLPPVKRPVTEAPAEVVDCQTVD